MNHKKYYQKQYKEIISRIAKVKKGDNRLNPAVYKKAKELLQNVHPEWDDIKLETTVLWDVRDFYKNYRKQP